MTKSNWKAIASKAIKVTCPHMILFSFYFNRTFSRYNVFQNVEMRGVRVLFSALAKIARVGVRNARHYRMNNLSYLLQIDVCKIDVVAKRKNVLCF